MEGCTHRGSRWCGTIDGYDGYYCRALPCQQALDLLEALPSPVIASAPSVQHTGKEHKVAPRTLGPSHDDAVDEILAVLHGHRTSATHPLAGRV